MQRERNAHAIGKYTSMHRNSKRPITGKRKSTYNMKRRHVDDMRKRSTRLRKRQRLTHVKRLITNIARRRSAGLKRQQRCMHVRSRKELMRRGKSGA